jgi:nitroimidazol reductase NimA-like FMN-containing flavoprotein (pyridoxamine 5'-phosphate oxidase superfamily)
MTAEGDDISLERLSREECFQLLATMSIGRVAVAQPGGAPLVLPVNFAVEGDVIVLRTDPGSKLDALRQHPASFQVDLIDPVRRTGWSVLVQGISYETSPASVEVESWDGGPKAHWIRIFPGAITGRRLRLPELPADTRGYL